MPPHLHYVEPFFGGGAVLFARDPTRNWYEGAPDYDGSAKMRGCSEVVNDIDGELMNFWNVMQNVSAFKIFRREIEATPFSQETWQRSVAKHLDVPYGVDRAINFFIRYRQSRQGLGKDFATLSRTRTRRGMNEQASAWLSAVEGLPKAHERLKKVVILSDDAPKVIQAQDGKQTHFYIDPPYLPKTRTATTAYQYEMTNYDHACLLMLLANPGRHCVLNTSNTGRDWTEEQWKQLRSLHDIPLQATFQLSGYHSEMYDRAADWQGWRCVEFDIANHASGATKKRMMVECLWMNF